MKAVIVHPGGVRGEWGPMSPETVAAGTKVVMEAYAALQVTLAHGASLRHSSTPAGETHAIEVDSRENAFVDMAEARLAQVSPQLAAVGVIWREGGSD